MKVGETRPDGSFCHYVYDKMGQKIGFVENDVENNSFHAVIWNVKSGMQYTFEFPNASVISHTNTDLLIEGSGKLLKVTERERY